MKPVRFHEAARAELFDEVLYYAGISPRLAASLTMAVQQAVQLASEFPNMGSPYKHGSRRVFTKRFPYSLVYLATEHEVYILALAPFSRKPGYWRSRSRPHIPE